MPSKMTFATPLRAEPKHNSHRLKLIYPAADHNYMLVDKDGVVMATGLTKETAAAIVGMSEAQNRADFFRAECDKAIERAGREELRGNRLEMALRTIQADFSKHGESRANHSDGEYTQDYTTRAEMVKAALAAGGKKV